jgi:hypothetical protein
MIEAVILPIAGAAMVITVVLNALYRVQAARSIRS